MTSNRRTVCSWLLSGLLILVGSGVLVEHFQVQDLRWISSNEVAQQQTNESPSSASEPSSGAYLPRIIRANQGVYPLQGVTGKQSISRALAHSTSGAIAARSFPQGNTFDTLWTQVFGYSRAHNSSQFTGPPAEALEDLERSNPDLDLLYRHGVYMASELRTGTPLTKDEKPHPLLRVCIVTSDVGVSLRVRARGPVLLLPCEKYKMEEEPSQPGVYRQCYGFDFFVPGLYGIEANVTYTNGSGMCMGCKRNELFMVPGYEVSATSEFEDVPQHVVDPSTMVFGAERSAKKWSAQQWSGKSPVYSGNRVQGTPFFLFVPTTLMSYERGERFVHSTNLPSLYQLAWNDTLSWLNSLTPVISAAFAVEDQATTSTHCQDGGTSPHCKEHTHKLPFCTFDDIFYGFPIWTDQRLLEGSGALIGTDGTAQPLAALSPKLEIATDHGIFAILQSKISLGQRCRARHTSSSPRTVGNVPDKTGKWVDWRGMFREKRCDQHFAVTDDTIKEYCVRRRWTERQIVHRLQGEHVAFQGDSTMRCLFKQLLGYLDPQFHPRIGWMRHFFFGQEAPALVDQLRMYLICSEDRTVPSVGGKPLSYDSYDALWQRHRSATCLNLVPFIQTFFYELGKLNRTYHGQERTPGARVCWSAYMPQRDLLKDKDRLAEVQREDVYICARSLKPCKSKHLEWSLRSRLFEQYRERHRDSSVHIDDFCCFEFPLRNSMKYFSGHSPQLNGTAWDPIRVFSTEAEIRDGFLSEFDFINTTDSQTALQEFAKSYYLLKVELRVSFSFASGVTFSTHFPLHASATRKVFTWGLGVVCGYSDVEIDALYDHFMDSVAEAIENRSPCLSRDKRYGHGAVFMNTPMRNRQKEFDNEGNSDARCSYYTNDRIARANAYMRDKYKELPADVRVVEVDEMTDAFPEGMVDGSHMCGASSNTCEETIGTILDALFMP